MPPRATRRTTTLLVTGALVVLLIAVAWLLPVPYVAMSPGPTENTLGKVDGQPIVEIVDHKTYPTKGAIDLVTVAVTSPDRRLQLLGALGGWIDPQVAVVPRTYIYPEDRTPKEVERHNAAQMQGSQQTAVAAAERELGMKVTRYVGVLSVTPDAPAEGKLEAGDRVLAVDGAKVAEPADVGKLVERHQPGDAVRFTVRRDGDRQQVRVSAGQSPDDPDQARVGITVAFGYDVPVEASVSLGQQIGGPSAGTMFALAIIDKLTPGSLTGGRHVAGTGTISAAGDVGPIGGVQQKVAGARETGATVFLTPAANCAAAVDAGVEGITLVRIKTLHGAVQALKSLKDPGPGGSRVPLCGE